MTDGLKFNHTSSFPGILRMVQAVRVVERLLLAGLGQVASRPKAVVDKKGPAHRNRDPHRSV